MEREESSGERGIVEDYKTIKVEWLDSALSNKWLSVYDIADIVKNDKFINTTKGYLIYENKKLMVICNSIDRENGNYAGVIIIPRVAIVSIVEVKESAIPKKRKAGITQKGRKVEGKTNV